jgi:hypothetical protein
LLKIIEPLDTPKLERLAEIMRQEVRGVTTQSAVPVVTTPSVEFAGFLRDDTFNFGTLYKMRFRVVEGDPGACSCEISTEGYETSAKRDQCRYPVVGDQLSGFDPGLVPGTYELRLYPDKWYAVPILIQDGLDLLVFDGWRFGRNMPVTYYQGKPLTTESVISITIRGTGLVWSHSFAVVDIISN